MKAMKTLTFLFIGFVGLSGLQIEAKKPSPSHIDPLSSESCVSSSFPSYLFEQSQVFPLGAVLSHPEDGKALADGRIVVGDEEFGLRVISEDGKSRAFGGFKEAGWIHRPPGMTAGPNGIFMERAGTHVLLADVYSGGIYRTNVRTEKTRRIYKHPFGVNSLVRDRNGTIWFTQSARNQGENSVQELFGAVNLPVDSGAVFSLGGKQDKFDKVAVEVASKIYFANGIALDSSEKYIYVAETMMNRVLKFEVDTGKKTLSNRTTYNYMLTPDNLDFDEDGNLWVASPISNKVFAIDKNCGSLHTVFSAPSISNTKVEDEWVRRSHLGKPLLELFTPDAWKPLPGAVTGMFWSRDHKTFYVTGLGSSILRIRSKK